MTEGDLAFAGIADLAPRIAAGEVSPLALTEAALARIEAQDGALNAFMTAADRCLDTSFRTSIKAWTAPTGTEPVSISNSMTATAYWSARWSTSLCPRSCSGAT